LRIDVHVVDCAYELFRHYYAVPSARDEDGREVGAVRATRRTAPWLKPTLINAAWAATRNNDWYLRAQFLRIKSRRGAKKAILAVASSMLTAVYYMLREGVEYHDLGWHDHARYPQTVSP
jgi:hypothetical protein